MSFQGSYALSFAGKTGGGNPDAGVGVLASDGVKNVTGLVTENKNGIVCHFTLTGSYTVNANGTGNITIIVAPAGASCPGSTKEAASVLFDAGNGVAFVNTSGGVLLGSFNKQ
jgi:hypothetical protein